MTLCIPWEIIFLLYKKYFTRAFAVSKVEGTCLAPNKHRIDLARFRKVKKKKKKKAGENVVLKKESLETCSED